jgi:hypothetical protein
MTMIENENDRQPLCIVRNYFKIISLVKSLSRFRGVLAGVKHILVDEVQNYKKNPSRSPLDWWKKFMGMYNSRDRPSLWVFSDMSQQVIREPCVHAQLKGLSHRRLNTIIRTTSKIQHFIQRFTKAVPHVRLGHDFEGEEVEVLVPKRPSSYDVSRPTHLVYILISVLHRLIVNNPFNAECIAVLFTDEREKDVYKPIFLRHTKHCQVKKGEEVSKCGVVFDTIRCYSGDENNVIIGFCPKYHSGSGFQNNNGLMVSLCSRAKLKLILILEDENNADCFKLTDCMEKRDIEWDQDAVIDFKM